MNDVETRFKLTNVFPRFAPMDHPDRGWLDTIAFRDQRNRLTVGQMLSDGDYVAVKQFRIRGSLTEAMAMPRHFVIAVIGQRSELQMRWIAARRVIAAV